MPLQSNKVGCVYKTLFVNLVKYLQYWYRYQYQTLRAIIVSKNIDSQNPLLHITIPIATFIAEVLNHKLVTHMPVQIFK